MQNNPALVIGAGIINENGEIKMAEVKKIKVINAGELPFSYNKKPVYPGEIVEVVKDVHVSQDLGRGNIIEVTKENEKELTAKYPVKKEEKAK